MLFVAVVLCKALVFIDIQLPCVLVEFFFLSIYSNV